MMNPHFKAIPIEKLSELMAQLPEGAMLSASPVGELNIYKPSTGGFLYLGWIEVASETIALLPKPWAFLELK